MCNYLRKIKNSYTYVKSKLTLKRINIIIHYKGLDNNLFLNIYVLNKLYT